MGYPSRRYPDSMANLYYSNNSYNDVVCDMEALWRADFQEFRQTMRQEICQMWEMIERMHIGPNCNHKYNDTHVDYGIRVRHTRHQRLAPINRPPIYEDLSDNDVSCVQPVSNYIYESPNRKPIYKENVSYGKKVELPSKKQCAATTIGSNYCTSGRISIISTSHHDHHRNK